MWESRAGPMDPSQDGARGNAGLPHTVGPMNNISLARVGAVPTETFNALVPELYKFEFVKCLFHKMIF